MKKSQIISIISKKQANPLKKLSFVISSVLLLSSLSVHSSFDSEPAYNEFIPAIDITNDTRSNLLLLLAKQPVLMKDNIGFAFDETKIPCNLLQFNIFADFYNVRTPRDCQSNNDDYTTNFNQYNKVSYYLELVNKDPTITTQSGLLMTPDLSFSKLPIEDQRRILKLQDPSAQSYYMYDKYMRVENQYNINNHRISNNLDAIINFYHAVNNDNTFSEQYRSELKDIRDGLFNAFNQTEYQQLLSNDYGVKHFINQGNAPEFVIYLFATQYFYEEKFDLAQALFEKLQYAENQWLKETATYMLIRAGLNQLGSYEDSWSDKPTTINPEMKTFTQDAIKIYLYAYPKGLYAESAHALQARLYWLTNESQTLTRYYENELLNVLNHTSDQNNTQNETAATADMILSNLQKQSDLKKPSETIIDTIKLINLVNEIDAKLFEEQRISLNDATILSYIQLLKDLRQIDHPSIIDGKLNLNPVEVNQVIQNLNQLGLTDAALYLDLIVDWKLNKNPAIITRIPAVELMENKLYDPNVFALLNLKSDILETQEKYGELVNLWQNIISSQNITQSQQQYAQLRLAHAYIKNEQIDLIFAQGSPITSQYFKSAILSQTGDNHLLREQVNTNNNLEQRQIALYNLLKNSLYNQDYGNFVKDLTLVQALLVQDNRIIYPPNFPQYEKNIAIKNLSQFDAKSVSKGESGPYFQCPSLQTVANRLAIDKYADATATLCLGDFMLNNFSELSDWVEPIHPEYLSDRITPERSLNLDILFDAVLGNPKATKDEKAYALFRKINCYYPNGYNTCSTSEVDTSERKKWFQELKSTYKETLWGKSLKYYW